jgi:hypothetical protein
MKLFMADERTQVQLLILMAGPTLKFLLMLKLDAKRGENW